MGLIHHTGRQARCSRRCSGVMLTDITHRVEQGSPEAELSLAELGVPRYDVVRVQSRKKETFVLLDQDRDQVLGQTASGEGPGTV